MTNRNLPYPLLSRLIEWMDCLLEEFVFSKKVLVIMFPMKKYFSAENVFIFQIFLRVTLFFISIVFFFVCLFVWFFLRGVGEWGGGGGVRLSMLMIFLS